jgi:hypothetical protein
VRSSHRLAARPIFAGVLVLAFLTLGRATAGVLVLDDGGAGVDFTTFEDAIAAGQDGDTILIKDGTYDAGLFVQTVTIDNKSLTIVGEDLANISLIQYRIQITNLTAGRRVVLRGIPMGLFSFSLQDNVGTVWFEDVAVTGFANGIAAIDCSNSGNVIITGCEVNGGSAPYFSIPAPGVFATESNLTIYDSLVTGGSGVSPGSNDSDGVTAMIHSGGESFLSGCTVVGGDGGTETGGDGIALIGTSTTCCRVLDSTLTGGGGSTSGNDSVNYGDGTFEFLAGAARSYSVRSPTRYLDSTTIRFEGPAGELIWLPHGLGTLGAYIPSMSGVLVTPFDFFLGFGVVPGSGVLTLVVPTPEVEGIDQITFYGQGLFFSVAEGLNLGSPSAGLLLDPAY